MIQKHNFPIIALADLLCRSNASQSQVDRILNKYHDAIKKRFLNDFKQNDQGKGAILRDNGNDQ